MYVHALKAFSAFIGGWCETDEHRTILDPALPLTSCVTLGNLSNFP